MIFWFASTAPGHEASKDTRPIPEVKNRLLSYAHIMDGTFGSNYIFAQIMEDQDGPKIVARRIGKRKARARK